MDTPKAPRLPTPETESGATATDPQCLGAYRLLRCLGEGGMGAVYLGYDPVHDRQVALKVLADHLAADRSYIDRFYREARTSSVLSHPNVVRTYSAGRDSASGRHFKVQEYVDGPNCQFLLDRTGPLAVADAVCIARGVACALEYLHARRLIHRDV